MKQRAPKRPASERRRDILEGAQAVFAEVGYANAATGDVARAAGMAPSAIYRHFPGKRELYLAALRDAGPRLAAIWQEAATETPGPLEAVLRIGLDYYDHVQGRSPYTRLFFQALSEVSDDEVRETIAANFLAMVDGFSRHLEGAQTAGAVRPGIDTRLAAWHFMGIGLAIDVIHQLGLQDELDREKVEAWGRMYLEGIRTRGEGEPDGAA